MRAFHTLRSALALAALVCASPFAAEQQTLQHVKDLYAQAAYEDALGALSGLPAGEAATEVARYRASCLLALGRLDDAQKAVSEIVHAHPEYRPDPAETSPRVLELFRAERRAKVPEAARTMYFAAKGSLDRNELEPAISGLSAVVRLLDDPDFAGETTLQELKMLAAGFLELARAKAAAALKPEPPPPAPAPNAAKPVAPVINQAVPVNQQLPSWSPPPGLSQWEFAGAVRVKIGVDGKVLSAAIEKPVHAAYDSLLLDAARKWLYKPALRDGVPVESENVVRVSLKPR